MEKLKYKHLNDDAHVATSVQQTFSWESFDDVSLHALKPLDCCREKTLRMLRVSFQSLISSLWLFEIECSLKVTCSLWTVNMNDMETKCTMVMIKQIKVFEMNVVIIVSFQQVWQRYLMSWLTFHSTQRCFS